MAKRHNATAVVALEPLPHLTLQFRQGDLEIQTTVAYRMVNGLCISTQLACKQADWPKFESSFFAAVASLTSESPSFPACPTEYREEARDGVEYHVHPNVEKRDLARVRKFVSSEFKLWKSHHRGAHGDSGVSPVVVVLDEAASAAGLYDYVTQRSDGIAVQPRSRRVLVVPPGKGDWKGHARLAEELARLFHVWGYGDGSPEWHSMGASALARSRILTGKGLPRACEELEIGLEDAVALGDCKSVDDSWPWLAYFRAGPKRAREAYAKFVGEFARNGDWEEATARHLEPLGLEELRSQVVDWVRSNIKPARSR